MRYRLLFVFLFWISLGLLNDVLAKDQIVIVRGNEDYPPNEMMIDNQLRGIHIDITREAANILGFDIRYQSYPWKRALVQMKTGNGDAISFISRNAEREEYLIYKEGNILSTVEFVFVLLKKNAERIKYDGDIESFLARDTLVVQRGYYYGKTIAQDKIIKHEIGTMDQMMHLLLSERHFDAIVNIHEFNAKYKGTPFAEKISPIYPSILRKDAYIAFSKLKQHNDLATRFADAITRVKNSPKYQKILNRYQD